MNPITWAQTTVVGEVGSIVDDTGVVSTFGDTFVEVSDVEVDVVFWVVKADSNFLSSVAYCILLKRKVTIILTKKIIIMVTFVSLRVAEWVVCL